MTQQQAEFVVSGVVRGEELLGQPYLTVVGRCGNVEIRRGDRLHSVVRFDEPDYPRGYESEPIELSRQEIDLVVRGIHSYGRERDLLDRGMTGTLFLTGEGVDNIEAGHVLYGVGQEQMISDDVQAGAERR